MSGPGNRSGERFNWECLVGEVNKITFGYGKFKMPEGSKSRERATYSLPFL